MSLDRRQRAIENGTFTERKPGATLRNSWRVKLQIFDCRYSVGTSVSLLGDDFSALVEELEGLEDFDAGESNDHLSQ